MLKLSHYPRRNAFDKFHGSRYDKRVWRVELSAPVLPLSDEGLKILR
jgi:hypothetical protein